MEQLQNLATQLQKVRAAAIARAGEAHRDRSLGPAGALRHDEGAIAEGPRMGRYRPSAGMRVGDAVIASAAGERRSRPLEWRR